MFLYNYYTSLVSVVHTSLQNTSYVHHLVVSDMTNKVIFLHNYIIHKLMNMHGKYL